MKKYLLLLLFPLLAGTYSHSQKLYEWRGKDRLGIFSEKNLLKSWPAEGPAELWSVDDIGNGFVSPVFTETNFYISGETDSMLILYCYDLKGSKLWQTTIGKEWMRSYPGSRCAPTVVDDLIYIGSGFGNLYCVSRENGKLVWSKDLEKDFSGELPLHGYSEAPLVDGNAVYWTPGGKTNNVIALDRFSGRLIWSCKGYGERSAYNPPRIITHNGRKILVTFSAYHLMGIDAATGKLLWGHEQDNFPLAQRLPGYGDTHCNTVIYDKGFIYYAAGDGNCGVKLALSADGNEIKQIWRNKDFDSYMGGVVKIGDYLYCGATARPSLVSINAESGKIVDSLKLGSGAVIAADDMLYYYSQKGELALVKYNQGRFEKTGSVRIRKGNAQHFSHPIINKGILYQRHGKVLMAFDIQNK
ncbi:MAG: PQQ-like beta-propeller repeat protein [Bacteroidales bacterium]|jgi:outer membrane protein assembly factor BamB|nr:PQQ-like beta-propeller repeat protein [Bacteroidales bacterium]